MRTDVPIDVIRRQIEIRKKLLEMDAPRLFRQFIPYMNPLYSRQWYHTLIADKCQELIEGKIRNLMIFVPPQHGKSEILSRNFPAWAFGYNPDLKIVGCSYSSTLAQQFSRAIQRIMDSPEYLRIFPDTRLNGSNMRTAPRG